MGIKKLVKRYSERDKKMREANRQKWGENKRILKESKWFVAIIVTVATIVTIGILLWLSRVGSI